MIGKAIGLMGDSTRLQPRKMEYPQQKSSTDESDEL